MVIVSVWGCVVVVVIFFTDFAFELEVFLVVLAFGLEVELVCFVFIAVVVVTNSLSSLRLESFLFTLIGLDVNKIDVAITSKQTPKHIVNTFSPFSSFVLIILPSLYS